MDALNPNLQLIIAAVIGYLFGSVPWGLVLMKLAGKGDIRTMGSGNIGATNVARNAGKPLGALTLILDASKGAIAALIFMQFSELAGIIAGFTAVLGHNFSIWLKFKGGKGVATSLGVILMVSWPIGILTCCAWLVLWSTFKYSSLASMGALVVTPGIAYWFKGGPSAVMYMTAGLAILSLIRHHQNIKRLLKGEEPKTGKKKPVEQPPAQ